MAARRKKRIDRNRYEVKVTYEKGKRVTGYGRTQAEAKRDAEQKAERLKAGAPVRDSSRTLSDWLAEWRETFLKASPRSESTKENYATMLRVHVESVIGEVRLDELKPADVVRVLNKMEDDGKAGSTRRTVRTALIAALADAQRNGLIKENVAEKTDRPRNVEKEARYLTPEDAAKFLRAAQGLRYADALRLALLLGLRRGEVLALRWSDVDLEREDLRVIGSLVRRKGALIVSDTKTVAGRRTLPLGPQAVALLRTHRAKQAEERLLAGIDWQETGFVFVTEWGLPVDPRNLLRAAQIAAGKAGLPKVDDNGQRIGVHTLRHSNATGRILSGVPDIVVSKDLGHSDPTITKRVYGHVPAPVQRASAEAVEGYFAV